MPKDKSTCQKTTVTPHQHPIRGVRVITCWGIYEIRILKIPTRYERRDRCPWIFGKLFLFVRARFRNSRGGSGFCSREVTYAMGITTKEIPDEHF